MAIDATRPLTARLRGPYAPTRKPDRRTDAAELRLELRARTAEEATYVARMHDGLTRVIRCLEGGLLDEAYALTAAAHAATVRRRRQLDGGTAA